jgi:hypothetical protein
LLKSRRQDPDTQYDESIGQSCRVENPRRLDGYASGSGIPPPAPRPTWQLVDNPITSPMTRCSCRGNSWKLSRFWDLSAVIIIDWIITDSRHAYVPLLKLAGIMTLVVAVPIVGGALQLGTPNQTEGLVTIWIGVLLGVFMIAVLVSQPPGSGGIGGPSVD